VDWSFADPIEEVELQLLVPPRSRTTWVVVHGGQPYVPCGFAQVPFLKQWNRDALKDGRALLRIGGRRYPLKAVRITDRTIYSRVTQRLARKYGTGAGATPDPKDLWIFRLDPRAG
jgi:hypothetical protein